MGHGHISNNMMNVLDDVSWQYTFTDFSVNAENKTDAW